MSIDWQPDASCTDNVQEFEPLHAGLSPDATTGQHQHMPIIQRGDIVMSANDYLRVHNTRLSDMEALPRELLCRYLATCPAVVRHRLLTRLCQR